MDHKVEHIFFVERTIWNAKVRKERLKIEVGKLLEEKYHRSHQTASVECILSWLKGTFVPYHSLCNGLQMVEYFMKENLLIQCKIIYLMLENLFNVRKIYSM